MQECVGGKGTKIKSRFEEKGLKPGMRRGKSPRCEEIQVFVCLGEQARIFSYRGGRAAKQEVVTAGAL